MIEDVKIKKIEKIQARLNVALFIIFLSLFVVFDHVQVRLFFLYFPSTPTISRGKQSNPDKDLIMLWRERKEIQMNQSFPLNSLQSL
jgi:hypothetical protein